ncbi:MAG: hypothetical protein INQ03_19620 [Candidatus Heimdallarchaeota archaeon]|nr:hypothetical protein [Candidatus Heimdallarchaeota archaeon]
MKILIPANEMNSNMNTSPSRVFGSARSYILIDEEMNLTSIENSLYDVDEKDIARELKDLGVSVIITEKICQTCYANLIAEGIDIWNDDGSITIREVHQKYLIGGIWPMNEPGSLVMHTMTTAQLEKYQIKQAI